MKYQKNYKEKLIVKSFDELANPHKYVHIDPPKVHRRNTRNKKLPKIKPPKQKCRVVPTLVHLYPEIANHNLKFTENYKSLYTQLVFNLKNDLHTNLNLLYNIEN